MKTEITIEYQSGEVATYVAAPPEWAKWEMKSGKTIQQASEIGINDLMFLAYSAMKRSMAGKPVKSYEVWSETVADVNVGDADPKVIESEALADS
jgi:hypothetical protein